MLTPLSRCFLFSALAVACSSAPPRPAQSAPEPVASGSADTVREDVREEATEEPPPADTQPDEPPCAGRAGADCSREHGCVMELHVGCRDAVDDCERLVPGSADPGQDGCTVQNPACVFHPRAHLCVTYTPITECPPTLAEAQALPVDCELQRTPFECAYDEGGGITFACRTPSMGCPGGMVRRPARPAWLGAPTHPPDYAADGCPLTDRARRSRCRAPRTLECRECAGITQCVRGRWQMTRRFPPRP